MKHLVVFSGAGISADSGLKTFRDSGGLWEEYDIEQVATPEAWAANPELVLNFYNLRREQVRRAQPNDAHRAIAELERVFDVTVVTQNIDDLHERAGSSRVIHLHGEVLKARSSLNPSLVVPVEGDIHMGDLAPDGSQLRPNVVWFGEPVSELPRAVEAFSKADLAMIVGTSLNVFPAANLIYEAPKGIPMYLIDPAEVRNTGIPGLRVIRKRAVEGLPELARELLQEAPR
ncbi:MAG: NAD-dependent deacylase [Salibacteraceae bacterium]